MVVTTWFPSAKAFTIKLDIPQGIIIRKANIYWALMYTRHHGKPCIYVINCSVTLSVVLGLVMIGEHLLPVYHERYTGTGYLCLAICICHCSMVDIFIAFLRTSIHTRLKILEICSFTPDVWRSTVLSHLIRIMIFWSRYSYYHSFTDE